eukprot:2862380-Prymnesium_polylepis.1
MQAPPHSLHTERRHPAVLADAAAAAFFASTELPAVLALGAFVWSTRLHPLSARRSHHSRGQLLVGVGGV